jgi:subtilisin family serine protease
LKSRSPFKPLWLQWCASTLLGLCLLLAWAHPAHAATEPTPDDDRLVLVMLQLPRAHFRPEGSYASSYGASVGRQARLQVAQALAQDFKLQLRSEWPMPALAIDCFVMQLPAADSRSPADVAQAVSADKRVAWAQLSQQFQGLATSPEPSAAQEPLYAAQPAAGQWHLAALHRVSTGRGVRIAIIDSGVDQQHPDLQGQLERATSFVDDLPPPPELHGTAVAGIIAARADNHLGIAGVAPDARLLALRACRQAGTDQTLCSSLSLAKALHAAIDDGAQILNLSWGGPPDKLLGLLLDQAMARGAAVVAAQPGRPGQFPAAHPGVLTVSTTAAATVTSSAGDTVSAPGRDVPSTVPGGGWGLVNGSSYAAPHVAGLLALLQAVDGQRWRPGTARQSLVLDAQGRVDACASLAKRLPASAAVKLETRDNGCEPARHTAR